MVYPEKLIGTKCYLSPIGEEDAGLCAGWHNDPEVAMSLTNAHMVSTIDWEREKLKRIMQNNPHAFRIIDLKDSRIIGHTALFEIEPVHRSGILRITIGEKKCWDSGYGTDALRLLLDYGFNLLNLHSIALGVIAYNMRAIKCYEKIGFRIAATKRKSKMMMGKWHNVVMMDILDSEFKSKCVKSLSNL
ncbi:MAG: GNAT family N-acetyltransferase [Candidatus Zixiibacteriota bacterium]|nr:MAG: GNAT family N-acetyltransferase [candidate division Zixibacteria bacterium]